MDRSLRGREKKLILSLCSTADLPASLFCYHHNKLWPMPDSGFEDFPEIFSAVLAQIINFDQVRVFSGHLLAFNNNFLILFLIDNQEEIVIPRRKTW